MLQSRQRRWFTRIWTFQCCVFLFLCHWSVVSSVEADAVVQRIRGAAQVQNALVSEVVVTSDASPPPADSNIPLASMTVPLHAHASTHHVYIHVGSPKPQRQTLILDTGSRYTAFPCEPFCLKCGRHHSNKFNGTKSTTLIKNYYPNCIFAKPEKDPNRQDNSCIFHQTYLEGSSWTAKVRSLKRLRKAIHAESSESSILTLHLRFSDFVSS